VIVNRLLPKGDEYFASWVESQTQMLPVIESYFAPVPISTIAFQRSEVIGLDLLDDFGRELFGADDPAAVHVSEVPFRFSKIGKDEHQLSIRLPFVPKQEIDISRKNEDLTIRIGTFKRVILLPRAIIALATAGAKMNNDHLEITFKKETGK
jgi:arsenite-transporting ATPase